MSNAKDPINNDPMASISEIISLDYISIRIRISDFSRFANMVMGLKDGGTFFLERRKEYRVVKVIFEHNLDESKIIIA